MIKTIFFLSNLIDLTTKSQEKEKNNKVCVAEAMKWLKRAQISTNDWGVSEGYHLYHGWLPSYPETTGYIIETFLHYSRVTKLESYKEDALNMVEWLCNIQNEDGSIPNSNFKKKLVFDTGQAIFGFVEAYKECNKEKYKDSAIMAGDWLLQVQENDGSWVKHSINNIPHTYYARVAWSLKNLFDITNDEKYLVGCIKNIDWSINNQNEIGWFNHASFRENNHNRPYTHTIAYTMRGILEVGISIKNQFYIDSVVKAANELIKNIDSNGFVSATFDKSWHGYDKYTCLTGNAQLAIILFKLYCIFQNQDYYTVAIAINSFLKKRQNINIKNPGIRGSIAGSYPIWGKYIHFAYPNWATKFFVDSLLLEENINDNL